MKTTLLPLALSSLALALALPAGADDGPWLVRARILNMNVDNSNEGSVPGLPQVTAENKTFPEVDFTYFFTRNFATELILTYPQAHTVSLGGTPIGSIKHLPPTLTAQYHFLPDGEFRPYVGLGVNYTRFTNVDLNVTGVGALDADRDSFGLAAQVGMDYKLSGNWYLNVDAKYVQIDTKVKVAASQAVLTKLKVDPTLISVGVGYRF